jgi:hypothetical protein
MLAGALQAGAEPKEFGIVIERFGNADESRFAFGKCSGFIDDDSIDLFENLESFGVLDQHASAGTASHADHDRHWGCES